MNLDPRSKLYTAMLLTALALLRNNPVGLLLTVFLALTAALITGFSIYSSGNMLPRLLKSILIIFLLQCLFNRSGPPLLSAADIVLVTEGGVITGLNFFLRMLILVFCTGLITTSSSRELIQGLVQLRVPYTLAMMTTLAVGFIPLLREEIGDAVTALRLRGINFRQIRLSKRIKTVSYLFAPLLADTIRQAQESAISLELRGFRRSGRRSSLLVLRLNHLDYLFMLSFTILSAAIWLFSGKA